MRRILLTCIISLLLLLAVTGCTQDKKQAAAVTGHDTSSCAKTSGYTMAETDDGYYFLVWNRLYYADKTDLTKWTVVCSDPTCSHDQEACPAYTQNNGFVVKDGQIYTVRSPYNVLYNQGTDDEKRALKYDELNCEAVYSMALDGTNLQEHDRIAQTLMNSESYSAYYLTENGFIGGQSSLQTDGTFHSCVLLANGEATKELFSCDTTEAITEGTFRTGISADCLRGDFSFLSGVLCGSEELENHVYRLSEDLTAEEVPYIGALGSSLRNGGYLSGESFFYFAPEDGYYQMDLTTGKSVKQQDAQLTGSRAYHLSEKLVVETNAYFGNTADSYEMRLYDGDTWRTVSLPSGADNLYILAAGTNTIFLRQIDMETYAISLYAIDLTQTDLALTSLATFPAA